MIGAYQGSSGAEAALKAVVDAMVFPGNLDVSLQWPVFLGQPSGLRVSYQRRDSEYEIGQTFRLLEVNELIFDIFIFTANEHEALNFTDGLEGGFNTFPLPAAFQAVRGQLASQESATRISDRVLSDINQLLALTIGKSWSMYHPNPDPDVVHPDVAVSTQEKELKQINALLSALQAAPGRSDPAPAASPRTPIDDWGDVLDCLEYIQSRIRQIPPYAFRPLGCRDLTAPEIWQLGISGRVYSVAMEYTATEWT